MWQPLVQFGESSINLATALGFILQGKFDWNDTLYFTYKSAIQSTPIVLVAASFIGMALSIQIAKELVVTYGADRFVGGMIAVSIVREIGPVFGAVALTGSVGSSIAAEIGSMNVTEQIDALHVFNISPIRYLVVPRLIATSIITPLVTIVGVGVAILAGMISCRMVVNIPFGVFLDSIQGILGFKDISVMLLKSICFGLAIGIIGSSYGLRSEGSAESVGNNTTQAVVWGLLAIFIINYIITAIFFQIGLG